MALGIALVVILILALISAALANMAMSEYMGAATFDSGAQALLVAEAGGEVVLADLAGDADWRDSAPATRTEAFPNPASGIPAVGSFTVDLSHPPGLEPTTNIRVRVLGTVRGASRTIQFDAHRLTGADFMLYAIRSVDITNISGGGSLQWHGSAYFEQDLILKGANQAGVYNDRKVFSSDPGFFNHLYVGGDPSRPGWILDVSTGNPTIGDPYYFVHVRGEIVGSSTRFNPANLDTVVPSPFYPDVLAAAQDARDRPGNLLDPTGGVLRFVVCQRLADGTWQRQSRPDLVLGGSQAFVLPPANADPAQPCAAYNGKTVAQVRTEGQYRLMWDPTATGTAANLVLRQPDLPVFIPGKVLVQTDVRYEGKATIVVAPDADPTTNGYQLAPYGGCALDFNPNRA